MEFVSCNSSDLLPRALRVRLPRTRSSLTAVYKVRLDWMMAATCVHWFKLYARYLCSHDALGLKDEQAGMPSAARDDRVSCIQWFKSRVCCNILFFIAVKDKKI